MLKIFSIVLIIYLNSCKGSVIIQDIESKELLDYTHVALEMVERFITQRTNTLVIMERCEVVCDEHRRFHVALLQNFLNNLNYTITLQLFFGKIDDRPWDYNLFIIDSCWSFELSLLELTRQLTKECSKFFFSLLHSTLRLHLPKTKHERQFYFFILLTYSKRTSASLQFHMMRIFQTCLNFNVKNVIIMHRIEAKPYISFYTYEIFTSQHCYERLTIKEFNRHENGVLQHNFLFPDHISNFHGCTLRVCGQVVEPLLSFNGNLSNKKHLQDMDRLAGIEGNILKKVAQTLNIKLRYYFPGETSNISLYRNSTGCFNELERDRSQIAIGALGPLILNSYKFSYSFAYHTTPYVFVVRGGVHFGPIGQLLHPLNLGTWRMVLLLLFISTVTIEIVERIYRPTLRNFFFGPKNKYPWRNLITILLGIPLPNNTIPKRNFARFLLMSWLLLTFELRNGYQGKMFDSLRLAKRNHVPKKIHELVDLDYKLLSSSVVDFFPRNKTVIVQSIATRMDRINESENRLTTTALLDFLANYNKENWNTSYLTYTEENIYFYQCTLFFPKHSILRPSFDRKLKQLSDAGITSHIAHKYVHPYFRNVNGQSLTNEVGQITHSNLVGLYYIFGSMCQTSFFIFIMELLTKKSRRLKRLMDWLN